MTDPLNRPPETIDRSKEAADLRMNEWDVMTNPQNPLHAGYIRGDPDVLEAINAEYKRLYGNKQVTLDDSTIEIKLTLGGK